MATATAATGAARTAALLLLPLVLALALAPRASGAAAAGGGPAGALYPPMTFDVYRLFIRKKGAKGKAQIEALKGQVLPED